MKETTDVLYDRLGKAILADDHGLAVAIGLQLLCRIHLTVEAMAEYLTGEDDPFKQAHRSKKDE